MGIEQANHIALGKHADHDMPLGRTGVGHDNARRALWSIIATASFTVSCMRMVMMRRPPRAIGRLLAQSDRPPLSAGWAGIDRVTVGGDADGSTHGHILPVLEAWHTTYQSRAAGRLSMALTSLGHRACDGALVDKAAGCEATRQSGQGLRRPQQRLSQRRRAGRRVLRGPVLASGGLRTGVPVTASAYSAAMARGGSFSTRARNFLNSGIFPWDQAAGW